MNITIHTDVYLIKKILKKTTLTKTCNIGDEIKLIGYLDPNNQSHSKLKSTQFQLVINRKKTDIFMPQRKMETFLKEQLHVINITKNDEVHRFEKQNLQSINLENTNLDSDFVTLNKVLNAYRSEEYFKELTKLFYNNIVIDFIQEIFDKGNNSYDYYFKVLYEKESVRTLVIYKLEYNWNSNTLRYKLKASSVEFKTLT